MNRNSLEKFLDRISYEREELIDDISDLPVKLPNIKVGDFGCGLSYITWCLMLEIPDSIIVGIDKYDSEEIPPELERIFGRQEIEEKETYRSIEIVQNRNDDFLCKIHSINEIPSDELLLRDICYEVNIKNRNPIIQKGDIVTGENIFPYFNEYFDLIYCKRVLFNIFGEDNKSIIFALNNITNALKPGGWFCLIEIEEILSEANIEKYLTQANFDIKSSRKVNRPYETLSNIQPHIYLIYHCQKRNS